MTAAKRKAETQQAEAYQKIMQRLATGRASQAEQQIAFAMQMEVNAQLSQALAELIARQEELERRLLLPREERPSDDRDLRPTPAMVEEAMRRNALNARISRAAKRSGFERSEWLEWCERHKHDPTKSLKTDGVQKPTAQLDLPSTSGAAKVEQISKRRKKRRVP